MPLHELMDDATRSPALLADDEPAPFEHYAGGSRPIVFVCDHASNRVPRSLERLGLEEKHMLDHIGWDIGAAAVARRLTEWFEGVGVFGGYSRLVVDLNRALDDASAFPAISDGVLVPGNLSLGAAAKAERARWLYAPYHDAVRRALDAATESDEEGPNASGTLAAASRENEAPDAVTPVMIAVHSFTPRLHGIERPWHLGVLWDKDPRLPLRLMSQLRAAPDVVVGDNEPYSGRHPADYTIDTQAEPRGIAHVGIEIRQDLIRDEAGQMRWAEILADALRGVLGDPALYRRSGAPA